MTLKQFTFKADDNLMMMLEAYAIKHKITRSDVIRLAIQRFLEEESEKEKAVEIRIEKGDKLW